MFNIIMDSGFLEMKLMLIILDLGVILTFI